MHPGKGGLQSARPVQDQHQDGVQRSTKTEMWKEGKLIVLDKNLYLCFRYGVSVGKYPVQNAQIKRLRNVKWNVSRYIGVSCAEGKDGFFRYFILFLLLLLYYMYPMSNLTLI